MNKVFIILLSAVVVSQAAFARPCEKDDRIHDMLPEKTVITFEQPIENVTDGVQLSDQQILPVWERKSIGRSIRILTSDKSLSGSYSFVKIEVPKGAESSDDTPFVFTPMNGQYLEIYLYQVRSKFDFRDETYISFGSLRHHLKPYATIKAECKEKKKDYEL